MELSGHFSKERHVNGWRVYEKVFSITSPQGNTNQNQMSYYLTPIRISVLKKQEITKVDRDMEIREPLCTVGGNVYWCSHCENSMNVPQKIKNRSAIWSINSILYPKEIKTEYQKDACISMFIATLLTIAKIWKQPKSQPMDERLNKIWL